MTDAEAKVLLFVADYASQGNDKFYILSGDEFNEADAATVSAIECVIICHDYWLCGPALFHASGALPPKVVDLGEYYAAISGIPEDRRENDKVDIISNLVGLGLSSETSDRYRRIFQKKESVDLETLKTVAPFLLKYYHSLNDLAIYNDELSRFVGIEIPVSNYLQRCVVEGLAVDQTKVQEYRSLAEHDYFCCIKDFSSKHDMPLEVPSDAELERILERRGYDFSGVSVDYILNFLANENDFGKDVLELRKVNASRNLLASFAANQGKIYPMVDFFGSRTSRVQYRDPTLQNLAKRYRDVLVPSQDKILSYVDFDQFEVGIMGALSEDAKLLELYRSGDMYAQFAEMLFGDSTLRNDAKRLFLSYAYGMSKRSLIDAAVSLGANRAQAKSALGGFTQFENWKAATIAKFREERSIGTSLGNYYRINSTGGVTAKQERSAISQVVQGTGSLIFKKSLLNLQRLCNFSLVLPIHDAVLVEHLPEEDPAKLAIEMSIVMTEHFETKIEGKASVDSFL